MNTAIFGRTHIDGGFRCAVAARGPKWLTVAYIADGNMLRTAKLPADDARYFTTVPRYDSAAKMARAMLRNRTRAHMTKGASNLLRGVLA